MTTIDYQAVARPITEDQKALVANLVDAGDIDLDSLIDAGYPNMSRGQLAYWLNDHSTQLRDKREESRRAFEAQLAAKLAERAEADDDQ